MPEIKGPEINTAGKIIIKVSGGVAAVTSTDPRVQIEKK
jgi:hypothetical protein